MSVRIDASGDSLIRGANLPSELLFSICGFSRRQGNGGTNFESCFVIRNSAYSAWAGIALRRSSGNLEITGTTTSSVLAAIPSNGTWFWWGATCAGSGASQLVGYWRTLGQASLTTASGQTSSFTQSNFEIGTGNVGGGDIEWFNGDHCGVKVWDATLSVAEMLAESFQVWPRRLQNLHAFWWLNTADTSGYRDLGPLVRPLTAAGTLATAENPPVRLHSSRQRFVFAVPDVGGPTFTQDVSGAVTSAGALARSTSRALTASITPAAALTKRLDRLLAGSLTSAGALVRQTSRPLAGTLSSAAALASVKVALLSLSGSMASAGALTKRTDRSLGGAAASSGSLLRSVSRALSGSLPTAGALLKRSTRTLAGSVASSGALTTLRVFLRAVSGTLASAGALARVPQKSTAGSVTPIGALTRRTSTTIAGALSSAGALTRRTSIALSGAVTSSGTLLGQLLGQFEKLGRTMIVAAAQRLSRAADGSRSDRTSDAGERGRVSSPEREE